MPVPIAISPTVLLPASPCMLGKPDHRSRHRQHTPPRPDSPPENSPRTAASKPLLAKIQARAPRRPAPSSSAALSCVQKRRGSVILVLGPRDEFLRKCAKEPSSHALAAISRTQTAYRRRKPLANRERPSAAPSSSGGGVLSHPLSPPSPAPPTVTSARGRAPRGPVGHARSSRIRYRVSRPRYANSPTCKGFSSPHPTFPSTLKSDWHPLDADSYVAGLYTTSQ